MTRKLRAKPEAYAARGLCICSGENYPHRRLEGCPPIADGTEPGAARSPVAAAMHGVSPGELIAQLKAGAKTMLTSGLGDPCPPAGELARLEVRTAERDRALELLEQAERLVRRLGGYMESDDQAVMREIRALLVSHGRREPEVRVTWVDRE